MRQVDDRSRDHGAGSLAPRAGRGRVHRVCRRRPDPGERRAPARHPGQRDLDDLPGADDLPQPGLHHRRTDRRGAAAAPGSRAPGRLGPRRRAPRLGEHSAPGAPRARLPAPALGGHAPAGDDRDCARLPATDPHRGRADHRPRRHRAGPDLRSPAGASRGDRDRHHPHHPRHGSGRRNGRAGGGHVRGTDGRRRSGAGDPERAAPSLYPGTHRERSAPEPGGLRRAGGLDGDSRHRAVARGVRAGTLPLRAPLPAGERPVPRRAADPRRDWGRDWGREGGGNGGGGGDRMAACWHPGAGQA